MFRIPVSYVNCKSALVCKLAHLVPKFRASGGLKKMCEAITRLGSALASCLAQLVELRGYQVTSLVCM